MSDIPKSKRAWSKLEALDKVKMPDEAKQQFATFIQDLVGRDK